MNAHTTRAVPVASHVEAFCSSGTSPGRSGAVDVAVPRPSGPLRARVGFELHGPEHAPPVVVLGGISAGRHLLPTALDPTPGWWSGVVGSAGPLDPGCRRLIGVDFLGGAAHHVDPPASVSTLDQAHALAAVLDHLGVDRARLVGASYGGMVALAFASAFPHRVDRLVVLCAAHRTHPMATALRSVQRGVVRLGERSDRVEEGLSLARALAMTTYRSAEEFESRFAARASGQDRGCARFPVEAYLEARGRAFAATFPAAAYLVLSESVDTHEVSPERIVSPTTLVSFDSDTLVPPWLVEELAATAPGVSLHVELQSPYGHDAFLKERDLVRDVVAAALGGSEVAR